MTFEEFDALWERACNPDGKKSRPTYVLATYHFEWLARYWHPSELLRAVEAVATAREPGRRYLFRTLDGMAQDSAKQRARAAVGRNRYDDDGSATPQAIPTQPPDDPPEPTPPPRVELELQAPQAARNLWQVALAELAAMVSPQNHERWLKPLRPLGLDGQTLVLQALDEFDAIWTRDNYLDLIETAVTRAGLDEGRVEVYLPGQVANLEAS